MKIESFNWSTRGLEFSLDKDRLRVVIGQQETRLSVVIGQQETRLRVVIGQQ